MIGEAASIGCAFTWALTSILLRSQSDRLHVLWLNGIRTLAGTGMVLILATAFRPLSAFVTVPPLSVFLLLVSVSIGLGLGDTLYLRSMSIIGVARAVPISGVYPLFAMLIAVSLLGEHLSWANVVGVLLLIAAIYFLAFPGQMLRSTLGTLFTAKNARGVALALAAGMCWAIGTSIVKVALADVDFLVANALRLPVATLLLISWANKTQGTASLRKAGWRSLGIVALTGFFGTGLGSTLFMVGVQFAGAAKAAPLSSLSPLFSAPLSALFLGERLDRQVILGTVLSVIGVWLVL